MTTIKNDVLYHQCNLSQGSGRDVAYIEERSAVEGKMVEIEPGSGDFWRVDVVGQPAVPGHRIKTLQDGAHKGFASTQG